MVFVACGLNHKTAPLNVREQFALADETRQQQSLFEFKAHPDIQEAALLSTCNRTEVYCKTSNTDAVLDVLSRQANISKEAVTNYTYCLTAQEGIKHAMRVACGLDSMMVGEPQILGQMKRAFSQAEKTGTIGRHLRPVFHHVFSAVKRIRTHTGLGLSPVSVAYAAVSLIQKTFTELSTLKFFLIGSGETSELLAKYLKDAGVQQFTVASRTLKNAQSLADKLDAEGITIGDIPAHIASADIIVSATACPLPFITLSMIERAQKARNYAPLFLLDLSVPRDIEPEVKSIKNVHLFNVDDLENIVSKGYLQRQSAAEDAEKIIEYELDQYIRWHRTLNATDKIKQYRQKVQTQAQAEVLRVLKMHRNAPLSVEEALDVLSSRLVNKLAHQPTVGLRRAAREEQNQMLELISHLFDA